MVSIHQRRKKFIELWKKVSDHSQNTLRLGCLAAFHLSTVWLALRSPGSTPSSRTMKASHTSELHRKLPRTVNIEATQSSLLSEALYKYLLVSCSYARSSFRSALTTRIIHTSIQTSRHLRFGRQVPLMRNVMLASKVSSVRKKVTRSSACGSF